MALQFNQSSDIGIDLTVAYTRIDSIVIENPINQAPFLSVRVLVFVDSTAKDAGKKPVTVLSIESDTARYNAWINACENGANPITVIYNYLKTLPIFNGSIDV